MNPLLLLSIFSQRKTIFYVGLTFILIILLPLIAIIALTQTGINSISDELTTTNSVNHKVEILNPLNGSVTNSMSGPFFWPIHGIITLEFGQSDFPYQPFHTGIDIAGKRGDFVTPFLKGKVIYAGEISWGYGKHIIIDHGNNITSLYGHLDEIFVTKDQEVKPGDIIGTRGSTGWSTGPHLHFQINVYGIPVNPRKFLGNNPK